MRRFDCLVDLLKHQLVVKVLARSRWSLYECARIVLIPDFNGLDLPRIFVEDVQRVIGISQPSFVRMRRGEDSRLPIVILVAPCQRNQRSYRGRLCLAHVIRKLSGVGEHSFLWLDTCPILLVPYMTDPGARNKRNDRLVVVLREMRHHAEWRVRHCADVHRRNNSKGSRERGGLCPVGQLCQCKIKIAPGFL
jgi:hypothetical protein